MTTQMLVRNKTHKNKVLASSYILPILDYAKGEGINIEAIFSNISFVIVLYLILTGIRIGFYNV